MTQIQLYDQNTIDTLDWPDTEEAKKAFDLFVPMIKEGVHEYIKNVETKLYILKINSVIIPITVNQKEYDNSYLASNYFPIKYLDERLKQSSRLKQLQRPLIHAVGLLLKAIKINKAVIVNNWLLTTNIYPQLSEEELVAITDFLTKHFPDHVLIFRSLNARKCSKLTEDLTKRDYKLIYSRHVFIYDPHEKEKLSSKVFYHHRRDRRLIDSEGYEVVRPQHMQSEEIAHLLELYQKLYLERHTSYSPQYSAKFLKLAVEKGYLNLVGLKKKGEIHGVIGFHERAKTLITPFCGYYQTKGEANLLYRMLTILAIDEAEKREVLLNDGSGGSAPKQYRGMKPFPEFMALYDRHLPFHRRFFWGLAEKAVQRLAIAKINQSNEPKQEDKTD